MRVSEVMTVRVNEMCMRVNEIMNAQVNAARADTVMNIGLMFR